MKIMNKIYERLTAEERFRAFVEAAGRGDAEELDRLNATCPRRLYECDDHEYVHAKTMVLLLSSSAHLDAAWFSELASFSMAMLMFGSEKHAEKASTALTLFVRRYRARMLGFDRFCETIGVNPHSLRQAIGITVGPMMQMALEVAADYPDATPTVEEVKAIAEQLLTHWRVAQS